MIADTNLQVWLETDANTRPAMLIPYVQSDKNRNMHYQLYAIKDGRSGSSRVSQSGTIQVLAKQPTAISRMSLSTNKSDSCRIELILAEGGLPLGKYSFACPQ